MQEAIKYIRSIKISNLIIDIILLVICFIHVYINLNLYKQIVFNNYKTINNINELKDSKNKYYYLNMKKSIEENYSILLNDKKHNIYTLNIDNNNLLIILSNNTILTNKTLVKITNDNNMIEDVKRKFLKNDYYKITLSNINLNKEILMDKIKTYIVLLIIVLTIISIFINIIQIINPKYTKLYKRLSKNFTKTL